MHFADPENVYAPLDSATSDWIALLDVDFAEAFRVRARLEREGTPTYQSYRRMGERIHEIYRELREIREEIAHLEEDEEVLQSELSQLQAQYYQTGRDIA